VPIPPLLPCDVLSDVGQLPSPASLRNNDLFFNVGFTFSALLFTALFTRSSDNLQWKSYGLRN